MLYKIRCSQSLVYFSNLLITKNYRLVNPFKPLGLLINQFCNQTRVCGLFLNKGILASDDQPRLVLFKSKHKSAKSGRRKAVDYDSSDDEDEEDRGEDDSDELDDKIVKTYSVKSMRIDLILKNLLGISRKRIEDSFYENKIRVNGKVLLKKSLSAKEGDEIDLIIGMDKTSSDCLQIRRVYIFKVDYDSDSEKFIVKAQSFKSLKIKNYSAEAAWKELEAQD